ncbi:hypothetical protein C8R47DRAFT_1072186 [Mycena vitilis]|nr:hypothetical protein C8R47DRAFT_1072186 [Mycena vitilis]
MPPDPVTPRPVKPTPQIVPVTGHAPAESRSAARKREPLRNHRDISVPPSLGNAKEQKPVLGLVLLFPIWFPSAFTVQRLSPSSPRVRLLRPGRLPAMAAPSSFANLAQIATPSAGGSYQIPSDASRMRPRFSAQRARWTRNRKGGWDLRTRKTRRTACRMASVHVAFVPPRRDHRRVAYTYPLQPAVVYVTLRAAISAYKRGARRRAPANFESPKDKYGMRGSAYPYLTTRPRYAHRPPPYPRSSDAVDGHTYLGILTHSTRASTSPRNTSICLVRWRRRRAPSHSAQESDECPAKALLGEGSSLHRCGSALVEDVSNGLASAGDLHHGHDTYFAASTSSWHATSGKPIPPWIWVAGSQDAALLAAEGVSSRGPLAVGRDEDETVQGSMRKAAGGACTYGGGDVARASTLATLRQDGLQSSENPSSPFYAAFPAG